MNIEYNTAQFILQHHDKIDLDKHVYKGVSWYIVKTTVCTYCKITIKYNVKLQPNLHTQQTVCVADFYLISVCIMSQFELVLPNQYCSVIIWEN